MGTHIKILPAKLRSASTSSCNMKTAVLVLLLLLSATNDVIGQEEDNSEVEEVDQSELIVEVLQNLLKTLYETIGENRELILDLQNETATLSASLDQKQLTIEALSTMYAELRISTNDKNAMVEALQDQTESLATSIEEKHVMIYALKNETASLTTSIEEKNNMIIALQNETKALTTSVANVSAVQSKMRTAVAFTAFNPDIVQLAKDANMKFPNVTLNEGGAYNGASGNFTAPMSGLYQLSVNTICNSQLEEGQVNLRLDCAGVPVFNLYSKCPSDKSIRVPASNAAAVRLAAGAECSVRSEKGSGIARAGMSSIFSGHVLLLD